jgi:hypothetical protein
MSDDAKTLDLVYASSYKDSSVYAYSYPQGELEGRILGVRASGLCSDANGNVFIPVDDEVREYPHAQTRPVAVLHNSLGGATQFCAVDPQTGNLAVSGGTDVKHGVALYAGGKGNPSVYAGRELSGGSGSVTYDNGGNLFIVGSGGAKLLELQKGASRVREIALNGLHAARLGSIQWDGTYLAAEIPQRASRPAQIARFSISDERATLVSESALKNAETRLQFWIHGSILVYRYPVGDAEPKSIGDARGPDAATFSVVLRPKFAVLTHHYDNMRTGWNNGEYKLTQQTVNSQSFGPLQTVPLDDQVDAQPLIVPNETTTRGVAPGKHDVVYVATENDTVYAIDASSGQILFDQSLGEPVPEPLGCNNNGPNVGINGTPVIDRAANVMYVIAYTLQGSVPTYRIHELSLADLADVVTPVVVSASHVLTNGATYNFSAMYQRQRPGLLESNGTIYAGFGSFCDYSASMSRGWLLGWQAGSLSPLAANQLNDSLATSPYDFYLSSIWMSGYGPAADSAGDVYFVTGNSDPSGSTYNGVTNIQESVVKMSADLTQILDLYTPKDAPDLDKGDMDFGSGGVTLLPQIGSAPPLAAAAGKQGALFLLNRNDLGGYTQKGPNNVLDTVRVGGCWCGETFFDAASDGMPRVVSSGGNSVTVWKVRTSPTVKFLKAGASQQLPGAQDPGLLTSVSSSGSSNAIIWAVARPAASLGDLTLFAFAGMPPKGSSTLTTLYQGDAGEWASPQADANVVPVVANGKVYVASYKQLEIFGLISSGMRRAKAAAHVLAFAHAGFKTPHEVTGTLVSVSGKHLIVRTRTGAMVHVDDSAAVAHERTAVLVLGEPFDVRGDYDAAGVLRAAAITHAKPSSAMWPADH